MTEAMENENDQSLVTVDENGSDLSLSDTFEGFEPLPLEIDADGGIRQLPVLVLPKIPAATPDTFVCLRGPCRHYLELVNLPDMISPDGVQPEEKHYWCRAFPGQSLDLSSETVSRCSEWEPIDPKVLARKVRARRRWDREQDPGGWHALRAFFRAIFRGSSSWR